MAIAFKGDNFEVDVFKRDVRGSSQEFEVVRRPKIVICVPVATDGRLVLIRQNRVAVNAPVIEFPAGRLETGESAYGGMVRELVEEAGFEVDEIFEIGTVQSAPHFCDEQAQVFLARGRIAADRAPTPREEIECPFTLLPSEIAMMIARGEINDCKTIAAFSVAYGRGMLGESVW